MRRGCNHCNIVEDEETGNKFSVCVGLCTKEPIKKLQPNDGYIPDNELPEVKSINPLLEEYKK